MIRALEADSMEVQRARAMIYGLQVMAGVVQGADLESRVKQMLEE